jgi:hypothetical protein
MKVTGNRLLKGMALCVLIGILAGGSAQANLFGIWTSRKKAPKIEKQSLVIFPFDQEGIAKAPKSFGSFVASDVRDMLGSDERYQVVLFRTQLTPIVRASGDGTLKADDLPYGVDSSYNIERSTFADSKAKTLRLAQMLCTDYYLVGAVDEMNIQSEKKHADVTLRAELYDGRTGKVIKTFLVTGQTPESTTTADEDELRDIAKGAAVTKLMSELGPREADSATALAGTNQTAPAVTGAEMKAADNNQPPDKPSK